MKNFVFIVIALFFSMVACNKESDREQFSFGIDKNVRLNGQYQLANSNLKFSVVEINDSRCPSDVTCIWEGKADVKIEVESPQKGIITLNTFDNLVDTVGNYSFELVDVLPYPISTVQVDLEDYDVTLNILELN